MVQDHPSDAGGIVTPGMLRSHRRRILALLGTLPFTAALAVSNDLNQPLAIEAEAKKKRKKPGHKKSQKRKPRNHSINNEERAMLDLINAYRRQNGLPALSLQRQLGSAARLHSRDQAAHHIPGHIGSNGSTIKDRIEASGYRYSWYGENVYWNRDDGSAQAAFDWWKSSPGHNANMLSVHYTQIGIAREQGKATGYWYWTTDFGRPG